MIVVLLIETSVRFFGCAFVCSSYHSSVVATTAVATVVSILSLLIIKVITMYQYVCAK